MTTAKAIVAGTVAGLGFAIPVVGDGVSPADVLGILLAGLAGFQATYWTKNRGAS